LPPRPSRRFVQSRIKSNTSGEMEGRLLGRTREEKGRKRGRKRKRGRESFTRKGKETGSGVVYASPGNADVSPTSSVGATGPGHAGTRAADLFSLDDPRR
jgi:hypothetical protein